METLLLQLRHRQFRPATREPSAEGQKRAQQLVKSLVKDGFTIVSGLAKGIDRVAHQTAIDEGGRTIALIGTPLHHSYPAENRELQNTIANDLLLISQVPVKRWQNQCLRDMALIAKIQACRLSSEASMPTVRYIDTRTHDELELFALHSDDRTSRST
ncbi:DNA-processing protein DprA [Mesorhizobium sp. INR15]|uniref:DNA-processing protein DprA n=1 Tax=Mesorhizobium sp. INR15 TaxID=2654248 RepID=UPI0018968407|nr:hypothetical protein GA829_22310 [Mesorhizobium sp. INR15]